MRALLPTASGNSVKEATRHLLQEQSPVPVAVEREMPVAARLAEGLDVPDGDQRVAQEVPLASRA